jgi:hypothetical protein
MNESLLKTASAVGKVAAKQAVSIGKEAYADAKRSHRPIGEEVKRKIRQRIRMAKEEAVGAIIYLNRHPGRAGLLALTGIAAIASFYFLRSKRP